MAQSFVSYHKETQLSSTLILEEYFYAFAEGVDAEREREKYTRQNKRGWIKVAFERESKKTKKGHFWITRNVWQKKTANRL